MNVHTVGELRASGYRVRSVKDEMRSNLLEKIARGDLRRAMYEFNRDAQEARAAEEQEKKPTS